MPASVGGSLEDQCPVVGSVRPAQGRAAGAGLAEETV